MGGTTSGKARFASVDAYLQAQPLPVQPVLARVRLALRKALPRAEETISYNIPTYKLDGRAIIYFAGWKQHYSIYPASAQMVAAFATELAPYEIEKGTIRFPLAEKVPAALIERLARFRAKERAS
jgi:uncharacterized protein YdhG (YjbR/CyaY superfamily)